MAEEISKPLSMAQKITMISSGDSAVGVAKLTGAVLDIMTRLPAAIQKLTGVNISVGGGGEGGRVFALLNCNILLTLHPCCFR